MSQFSELASVYVKQILRMTAFTNEWYANMHLLYDEIVERLYVHIPRNFQTKGTSMNQHL